MNHSLANFPHTRSRFSASRAALLFRITCLLLLATGCARISVAQQPKMGEKVAPVTWEALNGGKVSLASLTKQGPVVLVVLRGYPGYQCPICTAQVASLMSAADQFAGQKAQVLLVYPGPSDGLKQHADEFVSGKQIPKNFRFVLDPDYRFVNQYGLRWNAPHETAYPATFVMEKGGKVVFTKISKGHGGRAEPTEILQALAK